MNKERLLQLADHIEKLRHVDEEFSMQRFADRAYVGACETPSCIAGHAVFMFGGEELFMKCVNEELNFPRSAASLLDIDYDNEDFVANKMFFPDVTWGKVTPKQAAAYIRELVETGVSPDWNDIIEDNINTTAPSI